MGDTSRLSHVVYRNVGDRRAVGYHFDSDRICKPGLESRSVGRRVSAMVELEDGPTPGFHRIAEVNAIDDANERDAERDAPSHGAEHVPEELDPLRRIQLGRRDLLASAAHGDGRSAGRAQVALPVDLAPRRPDPAPARDIDDRQWRGEKPAALRPRTVSSPLRR